MIHNLGRLDPDTVALRFQIRTAFSVRRSCGGNLSDLHKLANLGQRRLRTGFLVVVVLLLLDRLGDLAHHDIGCVCRLK